MNPVYKKILIFDHLPANSKFNSDVLIILLDSYEFGASIVSAPQFIESNGTKLKNLYLDFIHSKSEILFNNKSLRDLFQVDDRLNLWDCSPILEASVYSSPLTISIKMLAIFELIRGIEASSLEIETIYDGVSRSLQDYCKEVNIQFQTNCTTSTFFNQTPLKHSTIYLLFASWIFIVKHFIQWLPYRRDQSHQLKPKAKLFFAPLAHLTSSSMKSWDGLDKLIFDSNQEANFIYLYSPTSEIKTPKSALNKIHSFISSQTIKSFLLESWVTNGTYVKVCRAHYYLLKTYFRLRNERKILSLSRPGESLEHILNITWKKSFFGAGLSDNLIRFYSLKNLFLNISEPSDCFFLFENQSWEKVLNAEFHSLASNKSTFAILHSTVRFWDLRFAQPKILKRVDKKQDIEPNFYGINGSYAMEQYLEAGFSPEELLPVESLRYQYLKESAGQKIEKDEFNTGIHIVIFGDYSAALNIKMLNFLQVCDQTLDVPIEFLFKEHINAPIDLSKYSFRNARIIFEPNNELFLSAKNFFFSNMTSAQVDALYFQIKPMVFMDGSELNLSPLRGTDRITCIYSPQDLLIHITNGTSNNISDDNDFLYLDKEIKKWQRLFSTEL